ncbi:Protein MLP1-like protein [Diplonema papillatum]|nr:Protein MLP1-like protein [Diplonema papillatum]
MTTSPRGEAGPSPVGGWVVSSGDLPEVTGDGLRGIDPTTGLAFVNLSSVPEKLLPHFKSLFVSGQGFTVVYYFGVVQKMSGNANYRQQRRILVIGSRALYTLYMDSRNSRCIRIEDIESVVTSNDKWVGVNVRGQHSLALRCEAMSEVKNVRHVLSSLYRQLTGRPLQETEKLKNKDALRARLDFHKPAGWDPQGTVLTLTSVTMPQMLSAREQKATLSSVKSTAPARSPAAVERREAAAVTHAPQQSRRAPSQDVYDKTHAFLTRELEHRKRTFDLERRQEHEEEQLRLSTRAAREATVRSISRERQDIDSRRDHLTEQLHALREEEARHLAAIGQSDDELQHHATASFALSLDRRRLCEGMGIDLPRDCRLSPETLVQEIPHKEPLADKVRAKISSIEQMKTSWHTDIEAVEKDIADKSAERARLDASIADLTQKITEASAVRTDTWDVHLTMASEMQEVVKRIELLQATTDELTEAMARESDEHEATMTELNAEYTQKVSALEDSIAESEGKLTQKLNLVSEIADKEAARAAALAAQAKRTAATKSTALETLVRKRTDLQFEVARLREPPEEDEAQNLDIDEASELKDAQQQLEVALQRIQELEGVAVEAAGLMQSLEAKEAEKQKLDFDTRELFIKGKQMKKDFESKMAELQMQIETADLKAKRIEESLAEEEARATTEMEEAKQKGEHALRLRSAEVQKLGAALEEDQREISRSGAELDAYYVDRLRHPFEPESVYGAAGSMDESQLEERLAAIDEDIEAVQCVLSKLDDRDKQIRDKFRRSEDTMVSQRDALLAKLESSPRDESVVTQSHHDLRTVNSTMLALQEGIDTFAVQARGARERHNQREAMLMQERDRLIEALAATRQCNISKMIDLTCPVTQPPPSVHPIVSLSPAVVAAPLTSPLGPSTPAGFQKAVVARSSLDEKWGLSCDGTAVVTVVQGSPVERAGLKIGHTIVSVNNHFVQTKEEIYAAFRSSESEAHVILLAPREDAD